MGEQVPSKRSLFLPAAIEAAAHRAGPRADCIDAINSGAPAGEMLFAFASLLPESFAAL